jgi:chemotaxis protein methyltransferase CheR
MADAACVSFLQWALPHLHLRWLGFRRVRRQVCRRIDRRRVTLGLADLAAYRAYLDDHPDEWRELDRLCRVTISRFARDRGIWTVLVEAVLPRLAQAASGEGRAALHVWSAGCGAGEEPYTLAIAWKLEVAARWPGLALDVLATDVDDNQLARAAAARFPTGTLRELPDAWRRDAFEVCDGEQCLRESFRAPVQFVHHDVRTAAPPGVFDLVLCRNLAFTYLDESVQRAVAASFRRVMRVGSALVVGVHEQLPEGCAGFAPAARSVYVAD